MSNDQAERQRGWGTAGRVIGRIQAATSEWGCAMRARQRENEPGWTGRLHLGGLPRRQKYAVGLCQAAEAPEQPAAARGHQAAMAANPQARVLPPQIPAAQPPFRA
jgi:hypothetical protein